MIVVALKELSIFFSLSTQVLNGHPDFINCQVTLKTLIINFNVNIEYKYQLCSERTEVIIKRKNKRTLKP